MNEKYFEAKYEEMAGGGEEHVECVCAREREREKETQSRDFVSRGIES